LNSPVDMSTLAHTVMSAEIEAIIFDFGGVLTLPPLGNHSERLRKICGMDRSTFDLEYRRQRRDYDRGAIDSREYWSRVMDSRRNPVEPRILQSLLEAEMAGWTRVNRQVLNWAGRLREAGMRTGILSNMPKDMLVRFESHFQWFDRFAVKIFSCHVGVNKPEAQIYQICLDELQLEAGKVLFLDDIPENVQAAEQIGIKAVLFRSYEQALLRIAENGWLPAKLLESEEIR
jgi:putative hydrolase of the HAD superfamily